MAKNANLTAVKVLDKTGSGSFANIIQGLEFVGTDVKAKGLVGRAVVSMSLGGSASSALNAAVASLVKSGVIVVVAAGNSNADAADTSPASEPSAITVGAIDSSNDERASFSNFGPALAVFAPGVNVLSSFIGPSNIVTKLMSGTSMGESLHFLLPLLSPLVLPLNANMEFAILATPHVAGLAAYLMAFEKLTDPAKIRARIQQLAQATGAKVQNNQANTTYLIANNGFL